MVIEPERDPEEIIAELERRIEEPYDRAEPVDDPGPIASNHLEVIRRQAGRDE